MSLLKLIEEDESLEFISLKEAINLLAQKTKSPIFEVAAYLLNKKIESTLNCYCRGIDYKLHISSSPRYASSGWVGENYAFQWLGYIAEHEKYLKNFSISSTAKYNKGCEGSFWKRKDFFNLECIKSLNLFETKEWNILFQKQQYIWDGNYLATQLTDNLPPLDINEDQYLSSSFSIEDVDYPDERWVHESTNQIKKHHLYFKNKTFSMHESTCLMAGYDPIETQWDYQNINWLLDNPEYEKASNFMFSAVRASLFEEFSSGEYFITSDNLKILLNESNHFIDGFNESDSKNIATDQELFKENELLKERVKALEEKLVDRNFAIKGWGEDANHHIKSKYELESELIKAEKELSASQQIISQKNDLLDLIFDESNTARYAPDLVSAIKLWEHLYINDTENTDKHSNRSNYWIKTNTPYQNETSVEVKRLREITSPFDNWNSDRKKKLKSN